MSRARVHPLTKGSLWVLMVGFFLPSLLALAYFLLYASINQTTLTPVNDVIVQITIIYGVSGIAIVDLGEQAKNSLS